MITQSLKAKSITRQWWLIDLKGKTLGRVASRIAQLLMGKHKINYVRHLDCGDYVVVINSDKVVVTGKKDKQKMFYHHTGYPQGFRQFSFEQIRQKKPNYLIIHAVKGMLPQNKLQKSRLKRFKVFTTSNHTYTDKQLKEFSF